MKKLLLCTLVMLTSLVACKEKGLGDGDKIVLNKSELSLTRPGVEKLTINNAAAYGSSANFVWQSDNDKIASVDSKGVVTSVALGTTKIWVSVAGNRATLNFCTVTVKPFGSQGITLSVPADSLNLQPGEAIYTASYAFNPLTAPDQDVYIVSSDSIGAKLATIEVTRVGKAPDTKGVIRIIASQQVGKLSFHLMSTVDSAMISNTITMTIGGVDITSVDWAQIDGKPIPAAVKSGIKDTIYAEILPANASLRDITWKSSNEQVLTVKSLSDGKAELDGRIKAGGAPTDVVIFAATAQGQMIKRTINVTPADPDPIKPVTVELPSSISFNTRDTIIIDNNSYKGIKVTFADIITGKVDLLSQMTVGGSLFTNYYADPSQAAFEVKLTPIKGDVGTIVQQTKTVDKTTYKYVSAMTLLGDLANSAPGTITKVDVRVDTKNRFDAGTGTYAAVSEATSVFATLYIKVTDSALPTSVAIMKSMFSFDPTKLLYTISANITPINAPSAHFGSAAAALYLKKGTVIAPKDTLKADKLVTDPAAISLSSQSGGNYFSGTFAPLKYDVKFPISSYLVRYSFTSGAIKHEFDTAIVEQGAPFAPRR